VYTTPVYPQATAPQNDLDLSSARPVVPAEQLADRLRAAAQQLRRSLSLRRNDADVWLDYLDPDRIVATIDQGGDGSGLADLLRNYDGVVGNRALASIRTASGFSQTHQLLRQFVQSAGQQAAPRPTPQPTPPQQAPAPEASQQGEPEELPLPPQPTPL
jgi:hypothetical protein